jgi:hypothetical protein
MANRTCKGIKEGGERCSAAPLHDSEFCVFHDPAHADLMAEARRAGGSRKRREGSVSLAYGFTGLGSIEEIRRLVEVAAYDVLSLENSLNRARALTHISQVAASLHEKGEQEERLRAIVAALGPRLQRKGRS